jgi:hypothetical protein
MSSSPKADNCTPAALGPFLSLMLFGVATISFSASAKRLRQPFRVARSRPC